MSGKGLVAGREVMALLGDVSSSWPSPVLLRKERPILIPHPFDDTREDKDRPRGSVGRARVLQAGRSCSARPRLRLEIGELHGNFRVGLDSSDLAHVIGADLSVEPESLTLRPSPTGKFNETWFADSPELRCPVVIRVAPPDDRSTMIFYEHRMMRQEPGIHARIRQQTSCPVPEVLAFGQSDSRIGDRDYLILERLSGDPCGGLPETTLWQVGAKLREVHDGVRAEPDQFGYLGEHRPMAPQPSWQEAFHTMWRSLHDDLQRCGGYSGAELTEFRRLLDREIDRFGHLRERASLLHMDVWAENILSDQDRGLTGLIDWDRACWGDPEIEFAVLDYCGVSTYGFWQGYAPDGRDPRTQDPDAAIRRIFYLLYEVQKYIVIRIARNRNPSGAERYRQMARALAGQLG